MKLTTQTFNTLDNYGNAYEVEIHHDQANTPLSIEISDYSDTTLYGADLSSLEELKQKVKFLNDNVELIEKALQGKSEDNKTPSKYTPIVNENDLKSILNEFSKFDFSKMFGGADAVNVDTLEENPNTTSTDEGQNEPLRNEGETTPRETEVQEGGELGKTNGKDIKPLTPFDFILSLLNRQTPRAVDVSSCVYNPEINGGCAVGMHYEEGEYDASFDTPYSKRIDVLKKENSLPTKVKHLETNLLTDAQDIHDILDNWLEEPIDHIVWNEEGLEKIQKLAEKYLEGTVLEVIKYFKTDYLRIIKKHQKANQ